MTFTKACSQLKEQIEKCDAILVGAGAGMSASSGFDYSGERFLKYFSDFHKQYGINDMYSGGFYPFRTLEEYWAWWSRHIYYNRYACPVGKPYEDLLKIVENKEYFVITTNVDHQFQLAGFDPERLFYTQGDYGLFQCSKPCCEVTYSNRESVLNMVAEQKNMKIPSELIPKCPVCGEPMMVNLRCDNRFVQDKGWYRAQERYSFFLQRFQNQAVLFLELGVGMNTPAIIKYPFWRMAESYPRAVYAYVNREEQACPQGIKTIYIKEDIAAVLKLL